MNEGNKHLHLRDRASAVTVRTQGKLRHRKHWGAGLAVKALAVIPVERDQIHPGLKGTCTDITHTNSPRSHESYV